MSYFEDQALEQEALRAAYLREQAEANEYYSHWFRRAIHALARRTSQAFNGIMSVVVYGFVVGAFVVCGMTLLVVMAARCLRVGRFNRL